MEFDIFFWILLVVLITQASGRPQHSPASLPTFDNVTVFSPPADWPDRSGSYARSLLLNQNCEEGVPKILATAAYSPSDGQYFIIFESNDLGATCSERSKAYFNGVETLTEGIILQPFLFELSEPFGSYQPGTILLSGNRIPGDFSSTNIQLYASTDQGYTWEFVSTVAQGGPPNTTNGAPCVWEPFILDYGGQINVYYSDQRDPNYGQKLCHQSSSDLMTWGPVIDDVAYANYTQRPGMITIAQIGNGQWMCSYEVGLWTTPSGDNETAPYATHYKIADSPLEFGLVGDYLLQTPEGISSAGPYTVWTPAGGPHGTIVVSDSSYDQFFLNTENGDPNAWQNVTSGHGVGYSRALRVMSGNGGKTVLVLNGGMYNQTPTVFTAGDYIVPGPPGTGPGSEGFPICNGRSSGIWGLW